MNRASQRLPVNLADLQRDLAHLHATCVQGAGSKNVGLGQLGDAMLLSVRVLRPKLGHHVVNVVGNRSKEKVLNVDAPWLIAPMANAYPVRDFGHEQQVGRSVGKQMLAAQSENPVATLVARPSPHQTVAVAARFSKESRPRCIQVEPAVSSPCRIGVHVHTVRSQEVALQGLELDFGAGRERHDDSE